MSDLVVLHFENGEFIHCANLEAARKIAIPRSDDPGRIIAEITPHGGGVMTTLDFERSSNDWVAI